jgi:hypothetical protein
MIPPAVMQFNVLGAAGGTTQIQNLKDPNFCLAVQDFNEGSQLVIEPCLECASTVAGGEGCWFVSSDVLDGNGNQTWALWQDWDDLVAAVAAPPNNNAAMTAGTGIIQWQNQFTGGGNNISHKEQLWFFEMPSLAFNMYASTIIQNDGSTAALTGQINFSANGDWWISGGRVTAYDHSGTNVGFTATCSEANISGWPSWSGAFGGNFFQDPGSNLTGSGNSSFFAQDWSAIASAWQSSGGQASCTLNAYNYGG